MESLNVLKIFMHKIMISIMKQILKYYLVDKCILLPKGMGLSIEMTDIMTKS